MAKNCKNSMFNGPRSNDKDQSGQLSKYDMFPLNGLKTDKSIFHCPDCGSTAAACSKQKAHLYDANNYKSQYIPNDPRRLAPAFMASRRRASSGPSISMTGISCTGKCYNPNMGSCECTDGSYVNLFGVETKSHMPFITVANVFFQLVHKTLDIMCGSVPNEGCDW